SVGFVRNVCGAFLFSGDDVDKPIKVLSGGEKARVSLAKILIKPGNLLVMDEPTNHLDLISSEILIDALDKYEGTLLFVSHNQSFINRLASRIWDIRDRQITEYPGTLNEYYRHLEEIEKIENQGTLESSEKQDDNFGAGSKKPDDSKKGIRRKKAEKRKEIRETLRPVEEKLAILEEKISGLETREKEISNLLTDPELFKESSKSVPLLSEYKKIKQNLDDSILEWEETQNQMEELKEDLGINEEQN
ncbi:ATP-binding cassette domain-containing protein, partial [Thermodesulfobacteriota bacterium]